MKDSLCCSPKSNLITIKTVLHNKKEQNRFEFKITSTSKLPALIPTNLPTCRCALFSKEWQSLEIQTYERASQTDSLLTNEKRTEKQENAWTNTSLGEYGLLYRLLNWRPAKTERERENGVERRTFHGLWLVMFPDACFPNCLQSKDAGKLSCVPDSQPVSQVYVCVGVLCEFPFQKKSPCS
jgi:hypothetical protein